MTIPSTLSLFPLPGINNPYSEVIRPLDLRQWSPGTASGRAVVFTVRPGSGCSPGGQPLRVLISSVS
ncbi:hypothetical protein, partial [Streptomyces sp. NPDC102283]|uniref:hypothetical protein n=1 Tax=Streptomyces sp. NPDC102283 TaxID=3366155 RepID=UPI0037F8A4A9